MLDQWNLDTAVEVMCAISSPSLNKCPTSFLLLLPSPFYSWNRDQEIKKRQSQEQAVISKEKHGDY